jgi:3-hydroxyisobutyrate dehydrogenase-like beta-hydroxyacid dehydrogenase
VVRIAFIGLGKMGRPMAANLVRAGYDVRGFDLLPIARDDAAKDGVSIATSGDAAKAMGALLAAVAVGNLTPSEAGELSKIVDAYVEALQVSEFEQRLKALEERADATYATF